MPKVTGFKMGFIHVKEVEKGKWRADWRDPLTKKRIRRVLPASNYKKAREHAGKINADVEKGRGFTGRMRGTIGHVLKDAVIEAIAHSDANQKTREDYLYHFNAFAEYVDAKAKGVKSWSDVTEQVLENYVKHCRKRSLAHDTIRLRLYTLRLTSSYMSRTYPGQYRDIAAAIRLRRKDPPKAEIERERTILSPTQFLDLFEWLEENAPMVHVWATLQGLCGLRMFEAAYLREQDIDFEKGTITITKTSAHKPKNRSSYRRIPVCPTVMRVLKYWVLGLKVRHHEGYLFFPQRARSGRGYARSQATRVGAFSRDRVMHLWSDAIRVARNEGREIPEKFTGRHLRSSFITMMREAGADFELLQRYVGHAPSTVLSAHYDKIDLERLRQIASLAQSLYEGAEVSQNGESEEIKNNAFGQ